MAEPPKVFISYSWDNPRHKAWVHAFGTRLRRDGIDVILDQWHAVPGDQLPEFMEKAIRECDFVVIVCTPEYRRKCDVRHGGVGYEGDIMTAEAFTLKNQRKFLPVLRTGDWDTSSPSWLKGKYYVDLRGEHYSENNYKDLLATLHNARPSPPPIGARPNLASAESPALGPAQILISYPGFLAIIDETTALVHDATLLSYTFSESRRILFAIKQLNKILQATFVRFQYDVPGKAHQKLSQLLTDLRKFISEADYVIPRPDEDKYTRDTATLKSIRLRILDNWDSLKPLLFEDHKLQLEYEDVKLADLIVWNVLEFKDRDAFYRFVSPHTKEIIESRGDIEHALIEEVLEKVEVEESELISKGYPKEVVVEVFNALMRDKFLKTEDYRTFILTDVANRIIKRQMNK